MTQAELASRTGVDAHPKGNTWSLYTDGSGRPHRGWTLVLASLGVFMTALDTLVVATALPVLRLDLHARLSDLEWTVNAYNLSFACLLLTGAALGDRLGRKRMFCVGLGVFTAASAAAALKCTRFGGAFAAPQRAEVEELLSQGQAASPVRTGQ